MEDKKSKNQAVLEDIIPLIIEVGNMIEWMNNKKDDMDDEDMRDNIENTAIEGNLSPKQVNVLKTKKGKHIKRKEIKLVLQ